MVLDLLRQIQSHRRVSVIRQFVICTDSDSSEEMQEAGLVYNRAVDPQNKQD